MDFDEIRRVTITALFSDEVLFEHLVLKGGNALSLVYGLTDRTSLDLDFSMDADFPDIEDARRRLFFRSGTVSTQSAMPYSTRRSNRNRSSRRKT